MKKFFILAAVLFAGVCMVSCSKDGGSNGDNEKMVGMWVCEDDIDWGYLEVWKFRADGTVEVLENGGGDGDVYMKDGYIYGCDVNDFKANATEGDYLLEDGELYLGAKEVDSWVFLARISFDGPDKFVAEGNALDGVYLKVKGFK